MGYENTQPKTGMLALVMLGSVVLLALIQWGVSSYFDIQVEGEKERTIAHTPLVDRATAADHAAKLLSSGAVTLSRAMEDWSTGARPQAITAEASQDFSAWAGWSHARDAERRSAEAKEMQEMAEAALALSSSNADVSSSDGAPESPEAPRN